MKLFLILLLALGLADFPSTVNAETLSKAQELVERRMESVENREVDSRLIRKSRRILRQRSGEQVVITRRLYEDPSGVRFIRETRRPIE